MWESVQGSHRLPEPREWGNNVPDSQELLHPNSIQASEKYRGADLEREPLSFKVGLGLGPGEA